MPQTFYIEVDEEIISVIGRLRKSSAEENIFVFPKRALVLQSIINLRLFQREAQKMGKKIVIVSQDEVGRMLAEKIGIPTKNYSEDFFRQDSHLELVPEKNVTQTIDFPHKIQEKASHSEAIGSAGFHETIVDAAPVSEKENVSSLQREEINLHVRNASPPKLTSLNSKRFEGDLIPKNNVPLEATRIVSAPSFKAPIKTQLSSSRDISSSGRGERLKNFYKSPHSAVAAPVSEKEADQKSISIAGAKAKRIFFVLGAVSLISLVGLALFLFLPKAEIYVTPYKITQAVDVELTGSVDASLSDENTIPVRILEKEKEVAFTVTTTGKSGGINQKARGTVIIYNNHSAESQPLVATTRLETGDGKLFRLVDGVTVPGMTSKDGKKEAGVIEAEVIADQVGEEYNIGASSFRIPGFKGGVKYENFTARSVKTMAGGGSAGTSEMAIVAKVDLDTGLAQAREKVKEEFLNETRNELGPDEKILDEQLDIVSLAPDVLPQIGTAAAAFEYKNTFKVRAFVFSEKIIREKIENVSEKDFHEIKFKPVSSNITYSDSVANFSDRVLRLAARALVTMESDIDSNALKEALIGQNKDNMQKTLSNFPEAKKIEVTFYPQWFVKNILDSENRVTIVIRPGEAEE